MKKWFLIVPGLIGAFYGAVLIVNGETGATTSETPKPAAPVSESCISTRDALFKQLSDNGWALADGSNFSFTCADDGTNITGEYRLGKNYVAVRARSADPAKTIEIRPLGTYRSGADNADVDWENF